MGKSVFLVPAVWLGLECHKFQVLAVGEKTCDKMPTFKIGEAEIECERTVKLLGVEIDYS